MRLPPPLVDLLAKGTVNTLLQKGTLASDHPRDTIDKVARLITEDLKVEEEIHEEARLRLAAHQAELQGVEVEYSRLLTKVRGEIAAQRGFVIGTGPGKLPRERVQSLAGQIVELLLDDDAVEYFVKEQELRVAVVRALEEELRRDAQREEKARQKVRSIRRNIPEGSGEFDALFKQFYRELVDRG